MASMIRVRRPFVLAAPIPISKSWLNRALILKSLHPSLRIVEWEPTELDGDDVTKLRLALDRLAGGETDFDIGESGTGLRFLIARLSVEVGTFKIRGSEKLFSRPHTELFHALNELGTDVSRAGATELEVRSRGWPEKAIEFAIDSSESSQFASALHLAASRSSHEFKLNLPGTVVSRGYLDMTLAMIDGVKCGRKVLVAETDASSVATLACVAVAASDYNRKKAIARLESQTWGEREAELAKTLDMLKLKIEKTAQPDRVVFDVIQKMRTTEGLRSANVDVGGAPDLFPLLAALCAFAKGKSKLAGAPHLRLKESDRIAGLARLFRTVGIRFEEHPDGLTVEGVSVEQEVEFAKRRRQGLAFVFDPESDHRLAFAAAVLAAFGVPIEVLNRGVVTKSLPLFWTMIEGDAPRVVLIGQRGAGKTDSAKRWGRELGARATIIDLDREVERLAGKSIDVIFKSLGESEFRWFERWAWREVDIETRNSFGAVVVSSGAGFDPGAIDDSWTRVWYRRSTDEAGRIFTDRPRLDPELDPLAESVSRNQARAPRFAAAADRTFIAGEGGVDPAERAWSADLFGIEEQTSISFLGGAITLLSHHNISESCERWRRWGVSRIEIRDDIWPSSVNSAAWNYFLNLPIESCLVSFRSEDETDRTLARIASWLDRPSAGGRLAVDWPLDRPHELPSELLKWIAAGRVDLIGSVHGDAKTMSVEALDSFELKMAQWPRAILKAAILVSDFGTLSRFHAWAFEKPSSRVFLPMTTSDHIGAPRWAWYRSWMGITVPLGLNFWREDDGSSLDQPTFSQWWRRRRFKGQEFAAVLGDPVDHSRTPLEHDAFFTDRNLPVFAIAVPRAEMPVALPFLRTLGLKAAAVTAPLKETIVSGRAVNTIAVGGDDLKIANTDEVGFAKLWDSTKYLRESLAGDIVVWGGGGVLKPIGETLPDAIFYSASTGNPRAEKQSTQPAIVIWAAGSSRGAWSASWKPRLVIDLSYTDNSMGRAVALEAGARYVSGLEMFEAQAQAQREFWTKEL
jgi:3-phosphoshikimate 1-carboxyvinyltransferase